MRHLPFVLLVLLGCASCDGLEPFQRESSHDPASTVFRPLSPDALELVLKADTARLRWKDQSANEEGYVIERSVDDTTGFEIAAELPAETTTFSEPVTYEGFRVTYRVSAFARRGGRRQQRSVQSTALLYPDFREKAPAVQVLTEREIRITWEDPYATEEAFVIERCAERQQHCPGDAFEPVATVEKNTTTYADTSFLPLAQTNPSSSASTPSFAYRVRAARGTVYGEYSRSETAHLGVFPPRRLYVSNENLSSDQVKIQWERNSLYPERVAGFVVEQAQDGRAWQEVATLAPDQLSFQDENLNPALKYAYRVRTLSSVPTEPITVHYDTSLVEEREWRAEEGLVVAVAYSTAEDVVFIGTRGPSGDRLTAWAWETGQERFSVPMDERVSGIEVGPEGERLLVAVGSTGSLRGGIDVLDATSGTRITRLVDHRAFATALSPDGERAVSFTSFPYVEVLGVKTGEVENRLNPGATGGNYYAAFHPTKPLLAIGSRDGKVRIYDLAQSTLESEMLFSTAPGALEYSPDGERLLAQAEGLRLLDSETAETVTKLEDGPYDDTAFPRWGPAQQYITAAWRNRSHRRSEAGIGLWSRAGNYVTGIPVRERIQALSTTPGGNYIVSGSGGVVQVWTLDGRWLATNE